MRADEQSVLLDRLTGRQLQRRWALGHPRKHRTAWLASACGLGEAHRTITALGVPARTGRRSIVVRRRKRNNRGVWVAVAERGRRIINARNELVARTGRVRDVRTVPHNC